MSIELDGCEETSSCLYGLQRMPQSSIELWNGREVEIITDPLAGRFTFNSAPPNEVSLLDRIIEQIFDLLDNDPETLDAILEEAGFEFDTRQMTFQQIKSLKAHFKRLGKETKKGIKKLGKGIEKGAQKTAHFGKKAFHETVDFVKEHKTECLVAAAVVVAVVGGVAIGMAMSGAALADAQRKKEDDDVSASEGKGVAASDPLPNDLDELPASHIFTARSSPLLTSPSSENNSHENALTRFFEIFQIGVPNRQSFAATEQSNLKAVLALSKESITQKNSPIAPLKSAFASFLEGLQRGTEIFANGVITPEVAQYLRSSKTEPTRSIAFKTEGLKQDGLFITFINGMSNSYYESKSNAEHIQKLSSNIGINGIYNHSNGIRDPFEIMILNYFGYSPVTQDLLIQQWAEFHENHENDPFAKCLHFCHSQGAIHTKNALTNLPKEIRDRVIVVAIAPATVVPRNLCHASYNYASKRDFLPFGEIAHSFVRATHIIGLPDFIRAYEHKEELIFLDPGENAPMLDHDFQSPTFQKKIKDHCDDFMSNKGQYK